MATTLFCYARLTQCSKPVKNRKKPIFLIYSFRFLDRFEWLSAGATFQNVASARRVAIGQPSLVKISTSAIIFLPSLFSKGSTYHNGEKEHRISCALLWMGQAFWFSKCALNYNI